MNNNICKNISINKDKNKNENVINNIKSEKGVTLIILITTVVILLILSVVTFQITYGDSGLVGNTTETTKSFAKEEKKERVQDAVTCAVDNRGKMTTDTIKQSLEKSLPDADISGIYDKKHEEDYTGEIIYGDYSFYVDKDKVVQDY